MKKRKNTVVINFYGGPGTGKSTYAALCFAHLKMLGVDCELVREYAKDLVWEERTVEFKDQLSILGKQIKRMNQCYGKVDVIVTDSPILLSAYYNDTEPSEAFEQVCLARHKEYNSIDVFLVREKAYNPNGRFQTEEAKKMDVEIKALLDKYEIPYTTIPASHGVTDKIVEILHNSSIIPTSLKLQLLI